MQDELRAVAEGLAARLGRAVAIDDPHMRLLAHTAHEETVDELRVTSILTMNVPPDVIEHVMALGLADAVGPVRVPAWPERGMLARVAVPVRCEGQLFGYLWLIDDAQTLTDTELAMAMEAAAAAGQLLHRELLLGDLRHSRERELLRDLLSDDAVVRGHASEELTGTDRLPDPARVVMLAVLVATDVLDRRPTATTELDLELREMVRQLVPLAAMAVTRSGGRGTLLVAGHRLPSAERLLKHSERLCTDLGKVFEAPDAVQVGIGPAVTSLAEAHLSHARAEDALRVAAVVPGFGQVVGYDELGVYGLLVRLPLAALPAEAIPAGLRRLIETDGAGTLVQTLETYLDAAGDARAAVEQLAVHRTSLYYRLSRIEEISGMQLSNGGNRLALHLGLKLARLTGLLPSPSRQ